MTTTDTSTNELSIPNKKAYDENLVLIQELKNNLESKQKKYKDDPKKYDYFIPEITASIDELETENKNLLAGNVRFIFL